MQVVIPTQVVVGQVQDTNRISDMLAPQYRDDAPKEMGSRVIKLQKVKSLTETAIWETQKSL